VSLVGEAEGQDPQGSQVPVRGAEQAQANAEARQINADEREQAKSEADKRVQDSKKWDKKAAGMTTKDLDQAMTEMDADKQPIDVMAHRYKALKVTASTTSKSVAAAEAHEDRVSAMEVTMKQRADKNNKMLEAHTNKKIPTYAGLQKSIETTIQANMEEAFKGMPYPGGNTWDQILPSEDKFQSDLPGNPKNALDRNVPKGPSPERIAAENKMLTQRQNAVAQQEKGLAMEKEMLKGQMLKVAKAADHLQEKFENEEEEVKLGAQKKVHNAAFALEEAMREKTQAKNDALDAEQKSAEMETSLAKAVGGKMRVAAVAKHEMEEMKQSSLIAESVAVQKLKKLAQTKIHAMARTATKVATQLLRAKEQIKRDNARIRYLKSKVLLQDRRNRRKQDQLAHDIETKESRFWNKQLSDVEKRALAEKNKLADDLMHSEGQAANVSASVLASQQAMQNMQMPLEAQAIARKMADKNQRRIEELESKNEKLETKLKNTERELDKTRGKAAMQAAVLIGKDKANKNLVQLIDKVNNKRREAEQAALSNAKTVEEDHQRIVDDEANLNSADVNATGIDALLATPCHMSSQGDSGSEGCMPLDHDGSVAQSVTLISPNNMEPLFPELLEPGGGR